MSKEPIAIIGTACRFPGGVDNLSKLWSVLEHPTDLLRKIPDERFNVDAFYHPDASHHGRTNAPYCYMLDENIKAFDPAFFHIQPAEAQVIDPQQRLLLETVYEALSDAGLRMEDYRGSATAVYIGQMMNDYKDIVNYNVDGIPTHAATGTATSITSNRVSYFFDWTGPSMTLDTACSSSLVAVHQAVQHLRIEGGGIAIAGGTNLILSPLPFIVESKMNMLSPTGRSRMWDKDADGYARGEGVAAIVLKTLSQALRDGDQIEAIIRETGVNQDGRSAGITMPSNAAQKALVRDTYIAAGLDPSKAEDRCQYFEAHGTGTPAGDPQEAEAITSAFFDGRKLNVDEEPLYVGSVKTVIGHTEGTAGLAGLLKVSLAMRHGIIPPNLLFEELSPNVAPFYHNMNIVTSPQAWPKLNPGTPRRASVNSFGFGGTNAHAIVESYQASLEPPEEAARPSHDLLLPIVLSAHSEQALKSSMQRLIQHIEIDSDLLLHDVAWTLFEKRSTLPVRRAIAAHTLAEVCTTLEEEIQALDSKESQAITANIKRQPRILGVFTGQGAQWPKMGRSLLAIPRVKSLIERLDHSLNSLPAEFRPPWTLVEELMKDETSNVHLASYAQPMCCAVQIILVDLLTVAGLKFKAVVGHSSGEIACAYAAGFITASQAIRVAHLRGIMSEKAASPNGTSGSMLAAGCTLDDAEELCNLEVFQGRVCVAACNAPDSVTLSGDADVIHEIQLILEDESKFARPLKVDKAYHSFHMLPCADPYLQAMQQSGCDGSEGEQPGFPHPLWISSVQKCKYMTMSDVTADYWKENLLSPVLFSQALGEALEVNTDSPLDIVIEVGPNPQLKGPATKTMEEQSIELPYTGCLKRNTDDLIAFAAMLGYVWERFGPDGIDFRSLSDYLPAVTRTDLAKSLPSYPWDHSRSFWTESRTTHSFLRGANEPPHVLLGQLSADSTETAMRWKNAIRPRDLPWLDDHQLQGQTVFPGAGYVVMALEAVMYANAGQSIRLIEITDLQIFKAVTFDDENSLAEINFSLDIDKSDPNQVSTAVASFRIDCCLPKEKTMSPSTSGKIVITFGPGSADALPSAQPEAPHMTDISVDMFYNELWGVGYGYEGTFRGLSSMKRVDSKARGAMCLSHSQDHQLLFHPSTLDVAFQTLIGAVSAPGDGLMRSLLIPTSIGKITVNPWLWKRAREQSWEEVHYNASGSAAQMTAIHGDIELYDATTSSVLLQIENISTRAASAASAANDHLMFHKWKWDKLLPDSRLHDPQHAVTDKDREEALAMERIVYFYMRTFMEEVDLEGDRVSNLENHYQKQLRWFQHMLDEAKNGHSQFYSADWESDSEADIQHVIEKHGLNAHVRLIQRVGEGLSEVIYQERNPFELMDHDGILTEFYESETGFGPAYFYLQQAIAPIMHRYQGMNILEIGAGTGGATKYILTERDPPSFNSYTFTDISASFFEKAHENFAQFEDRMDFRTLDVVQDPVGQGYKPNSYDMIIASNVLHATPVLEHTLGNVRSLLKPGGHLFVVELTCRRHSRIGFIFGLFADWWAGEDEGRVLEPYVSIDAWDKILKSTGFSGVSSRFEEDEGEIFPTSVFRSEAVNDQMARLAQPLSSASKEAPAPLVFVGGNTSKTAGILLGVQRLLSDRQIITAKRLEDLLQTDLSPESTFLVVFELDSETFSALDQTKFNALQKLFANAGKVLWLTEHAFVEHPHQAMTIGFLRTLRLEYPATDIQVLDVDQVDELDIEFLCGQVVRLEDGSSWEDDGLLWSTEPEIFVRDGCSFIPRLKPDQTKNDRLNSRRREILSDLSPTAHSILLRFVDGTASLECKDSYAPAYVDKSLETSYIEIETHYSSSQAIRVQELGLFNVLLGLKTNGHTPVVALSQENGSLVKVPRDHVIPLADNFSIDHNSGAFLLAVVADLLVQTIVAETAEGAKLLTFMCPPLYAEALARHAEVKGIQVRLATTAAVPETERTATKSAQSWIQLHEKETQSGIEKKLHVDSVDWTFYSFSTDRSVPGVGQSLSEFLSVNGSRVYQAEHLARAAASIWTEQTGDGLKVMLREAVQAAANLTTFSRGIVATPVQEMVALQKKPDFSTIVDWKSNDLISARVLPIDSGRLFSNDKTYLLVGLTGDLGRSICRWMILHGAKHIVLSSRNPSIDPAWLNEMTALEGNVLVLPMDVANEESLDAGLSTISEKKMPAIGGVAFGPLVLHDILFTNMEIDMMTSVLNPKVKGAQLLNQRLANNTLEFFVMFSSFVMVCGNPGQSAYSAANAFTHALAQQRRAKGQAASTIDMGAIWGVGYIVRQGRDEEYDLISFKFDKVSEQELHALFAEAIVSGRSSNTDEDVEVITGMRFLNPDNKELIPHFDDPRLGHYILPEERANAAAGDSDALVSVKDRLLEAETMDQVLEIITEGLASKLRMTLNIASDDSVDLQSPLVDQGVDSLSAVAIGTWFSKNLNLELPVLKILGGASITDLSEEAAERLPPSVIPLVSGDSSAGEKTTTDGDASHSTPKPNGTTKKNDSQSTAPRANGTAQKHDESLTQSKMNGSILPGKNSTPEGSYKSKTRSSPREAPMSLQQEHFWKIQKQSGDETLLNSTIGMWMKGYMDLERLSRAFEKVLQRHETFRTCFINDSETHSSSPKQTVLYAPIVQLHNIAVDDRAAAEREFERIDSEAYDLEKGDTLKLVNLHWTPNDHLLIIAYNQLVCDGFSYEQLFIELSQIYNDPTTRLKPPHQYVEYAIRQRDDYEHGRMDEDIGFWKSMHQPQAPNLPLMRLPGTATERRSISSDQHSKTARLDSSMSARIKKASQQSKTTPMQFYLATYAVLLAKLTGIDDLVIGVADANRSTLESLSTMGFFLNLLPVRLACSSQDTFEAVLSNTKDQMRKALLHSNVPHHIILERLGLSLETSEPESQPLFQATFDYKQGQAESGSIGEASMVGVLASRSRTPYDVTLEMSDDPTKSPLITFKLQNSIYASEGLEQLMNHYFALLEAFSTDSKHITDDIALCSDEAK